MQAQTSKPSSRIILIMLLLLLATLVWMQGCSTLQDLVRNIEKPRLSVTDVQVIGFDFTGLNLAFEINVKNPNPLSVQLLAYDYGLDINEQTLVSGQQDQRTRIEASGESTIQVPVRLEFREVYRAVERLAANNGAAYSFSGTATFELPGMGRTDVPVRKEGEIPVLRMPSIRITGLHVEELTLSSATLRLGMEFDNPNGIGFHVNALDYRLNIDGTPWIKETALEGITIPENGVSRLEVPITLNLSQLGMSAYRLLTGSQEVDYDFSGTFSLNILHPMLGETALEIERTGQFSVDNY